MYWLLALTPVTTFHQPGSGLLITSPVPRLVIVPLFQTPLPESVPAIPPTDTHLGLSRGVPELPREVVIHDEYVVTVRTDGAAPDGKAAWTLLGRGTLSEDIVVALARKKIDVRDAIEVRIDRSPRELVEHYSGSPYGVLWQGRGTVAHRLGPRTPIAGVHLAGASANPGAGLASVGLSASLVAQAVGPA